MDDIKKEKGIDFKKERAELVDMLLQTKRICKAILDSAENDTDKMSGTMLAQILSSFKLIDTLLKEGEEIQKKEQMYADDDDQSPYPDQPYFKGRKVPFPTKTMTRDKEGDLQLVLPERK
ncbi:MAG: hypothetical protein JRJ00_00705 [Deltaproteobacteria bacterium]|nr:hypothetical protein [Deltaproteobacteria bacterium]